MSTLTFPDIPLQPDNPAERLRRLAGAVRVHFTWWGTRRTLTREQKEEAAQPFGAEGQFLSAGKKLIDTRHEAFRRLTAIRGKIIADWRNCTLPYVEAGVRLIRQTDIEPFVRVLENHRDALRQAESDLNAAYEQIKTDARNRLGRLYNVSDYPSEIRNLFLVEWDFPAIEPPTYLMRLNPEIYRQEQERVAQRFEQVVQLAEQAFIGELAKLVSHLTERLTTNTGGEQKVFRNSVISNLTDFFARFRDLNIRSNAQLDQLVEQAQQIVRGIGPQELRDNNSLRTHVATELSRVQAELDGMLIDRPRRRIIRTNPENQA
jgi:hypothetical protein